MPLPWNDFLLSPAIAYVAEETSKPPRCQGEYYWHKELLEKWKRISPVDDADAGSIKRGLPSTIDYGSYILMATAIAENLSRRLSLTVPGHASRDGNQQKNFVDKRVGIAIPEGPFLPLYTLAVHSLNVSVGEGWLDCENEATHTFNRCKGVVLVPIEIDEAPERLMHILGDSSPSLILVAPEKDREDMETVGQKVVNQSKTALSSIPLVDYTQLMEEALSSLHTHKQLNGSFSLVKKLWQPDIQNDCIDSIRHTQAVPGCFDVATLVAIGSVRLKSIFSTNTLSTNHALLPTREIMSHIVYTSGTTGTPKGCVSSLASLQHYIRAKNLAHGIHCESRILLASAITFDPCLSDILATCAANATLCIAPREQLYSHGDDRSIKNNEHDKYRGLTKVLRQLEVSHVLCTPALWATVDGNPNTFPSLKVVALGGEPIPKVMMLKWARSKSKSQTDEWNRQYPRLCSTYGVTEACVYQTYGEVVLDTSDTKIMPGQSVGQPLKGTTISICHPCPEDDTMDQDNMAALRQVEQDGKTSEPYIGEVVLSGIQVDALSSYLNLPELSSRVFVQCCNDKASLGIGTHFYRTGDLGYADMKTGNLHILGRINGDGQVKINGIRIELGAIENSVIDALAGDEEGMLVTDCMAAMTTSFMSSEGDEHQHKQLTAYCILSSASILQLGLLPGQLKNGAIVPPGPLLSLLRARCDRRVRRGCTPSFFVLIDRLPLSPTGKRYRSGLPPLSACSIMGGGTLNDDKKYRLLRNDGKVGNMVADKICESLNLQPCQRQLVTLDANFFVLGGDSLAATRVVRGLYAKYHGILDSRNLGGATGTLDGPFAAKYLLQSDTLGDYVNFLKSTGGDKLNAHVTGKDLLSVNSNINSVRKPKDTYADPLYESLIEAIMLGYPAVASSLLSMGVDPNSQPNIGRLGNVTDRRQQRKQFKSSPLHLATLRGNPYLVKQLLSRGCKPNSPDASGSFPIHLACSRLDKGDSDEEDLNRLECVKLILDSGRTPISMKDGNKQTILHSAARSGHCKLLQYIMTQWKIAAETMDIKFKSHNNVPGRHYDWLDRWSRTPVHWAILNQRTSSLRILLDGGCSAFPPKPKSGVSKRATSVIIETPLEMCMRLYGDTPGIGEEMSCLLKNAKY